jgi:hypothetical protein
MKEQDPEPDPLVRGTYPDLYTDVIDPEHWLLVSVFLNKKSSLAHCIS